MGSARESKLHMGGTRKPFDSLEHPPEMSEKVQTPRCPGENSKQMWTCTMALSVPGCDRVWMLPSPTSSCPTPTWQTPPPCP